MPLKMKLFQSKFKDCWKVVTRLCLRSIHFLFFSVKKVDKKNDDDDGTEIETEITEWSFRFVDKS